MEWIWPGRFARGKFTLLAGEPGVGKSYLMLDIAARISRGGAFPDGAPPLAGPVLILSAEDGLADTIRPRLDTLTANVQHVFALEAIREKDDTRSSLSLERDIPILLDTVRQVHPVLVCIDPIWARQTRIVTWRCAPFSNP